MNFTAKYAAKLALRPVPVALVPEPVPVAPAPPATPATPAQTAAKVAALRQEIAAYRAGPAEKPFPGEHEKIHSDAYRPSPSKSVHDAAIAVCAADPKLSYADAVRLVTRKS